MPSVAVADEHAFVGECSTDKQISVLQQGCDAAIGIPFTAVVGGRPAGFDLSRVPADADIFVDAVRFAREITMLLLADGTGTITSVLSILLLIQFFSNAFCFAFHVNFRTPSGAGRVTPALKALPQMSGTGFGYAPF